METLNFDLCNCPFCLTNDRERLYLIYFTQNIFPSIKNPSEFSVLDFAPNAQFSKYLKGKGVKYISTDISMEGVDIHLNICNMDALNDNSYDFIICSHILEHVDVPEDALRELYRVLKPEGSVILMVPLFWDVKETLEDKSHTSKEDRCKYYGQDDHVRLFSRQDFLNRISQAGFEIEMLKPEDFDKKLISENAISDNSILYIGLKK
jgi:predicted SAM-dependent methyltransferase